MKKNRMLPVFLLLFFQLVTSSIYATPSKTKIYVANFKGNSISVIDPALKKVTYTINVPNSPEGMVITPDGQYVYLNSSDDGQVSVIDTTKDAVIANIDVGYKPKRLAITADGTRILVSVANAVVSIDTHSNQVVHHYPIIEPHNIAISPDGKTAYVGSQDPEHFALVVLNLTRNRIEGKIPLHYAPRDIQFSPNTKYLYFTVAGDNSILILDTIRHQIIAKMPAGSSPHGLLFSHSGDLGFIVSQGSGQLQIFNPKLSNTAHEISLGKLPHSIALTPNDTKAYVTNEGSNTVSVVDIPSMTRTHTISVGKGPRSIVIIDPPQAIHEISIENYHFVPRDITVSIGTEVTWANNDVVPHTITNQDHKINSNELAPGTSYQYTFNNPGTYLYFSEAHPFMMGKVIVQ